MTSRSAWFSAFEPYTYDATCLASCWKIGDLEMSSLPSDPFCADVYVSIAFLDNFNRAISSFSVISNLLLNPFYPRYDLSVSSACKKHVENTILFSSVLLTKLVNLSLSERSNSSKASSRVCLTWFINPCCFSKAYLIELCRIEIGNSSNASVTMNILTFSLSTILLNSLISCSRSGR